MIRAAVFAGVLDAIFPYPKNKAPKRTMFVAIMLLSPQSYLEYKSRKAVLKHIWLIREEVTRQSPGMNGVVRDIIAGKVNDHVCRNGSWPGPYCVFDGQEYHKAFRRTTFWSHNRRQSKEEGVRLTQETDSHDVMLVYEESIHRWWRGYLKFLNHDSSIQFTKEKLPKDVYLCKLT